MNEQATQEKEFRSILSRIQGFGDERDKLIMEIDEILDRLRRNRKQTAEPKTAQLTGLSVPEVEIISVLEVRLKEMDLANERLRAISNRLNELM